MTKPKIKKNEKILREERTESLNFYIIHLFQTCFIAKHVEKQKKGKISV